MWCPICRVVTQVDNGQNQNAGSGAGLVLNQLSQAPDTVLGEAAAWHMKSPDTPTVQDRRPLASSASPCHLPCRGFIVLTSFLSFQISLNIMLQS